jgi:cob(I)alamin adenosyltransferase
MKIYTKKGDKGTTQLIGGTRVPKHHLRIEAYGTVDELNSFIGLVRDQKTGARYKKVLSNIQDKLFVIGSELAADPEKSLMKLPEITEQDVEVLEKEIDEMTAKLPELKSFILPGGHTAVSFCHIARTVCRRAERIATHLSEEAPVDVIIVKYLNRLSDYLFTLARMISKNNKVKEILWKP